MVPLGQVKTLLGGDWKRYGEDGYSKGRNACDWARDGREGGGGRVQWKWGTETRKRGAGLAENLRGSEGGCRPKKT